MPGYEDYYSGSIPEGARFRFEKRSTPCCPHCNSTDFDRCERDARKPTHFGIAKVRCAECGEWSHVCDLILVYESEYHFEEA